MSKEQGKDKELSFDELKEVSGGISAGAECDPDVQPGKKKAPLDGSGRKFVTTQGVPWAMDSPDGSGFPKK